MIDNTVFFPDGWTNRQRNYNMWDETSGKMIRALLDVLVTHVFYQLLYRDLPRETFKDHMLNYQQRSVTKKNYTKTAPFWFD